MKDRYTQLANARNLLGVPESATMATIKSAYRRRLSTWHPDKHPEDSERASEMTRSLIDAYQVLMTYCRLYQYDFGENEVQRQYAGDDWWETRFGDDPLWGHKKRSE